MLDNNLLLKKRLINIYFNLLRILPSKFFLKYFYKKKLGYNLNLNKPQKFTEKLQWLKLHNYNFEYIKMVDKAQVKDYVSKLIGDKYIIPTFGVWDSFNAIDFDVLPDEFVLKTTHGAGSVFVCKDKKTFDYEKAKNILTVDLHTNYYLWGREWPYKYVKPRIIAEKFIYEQNSKHIPIDYKLYCFNGEVKFILICSNRDLNTKKSVTRYFDENFNEVYVNNNVFNNPIEKPKNFLKMKELAYKLSKDLPHVRVDFYEINDKIYFGELTFFSSSGFIKFNSEDIDLKLGSYLDLSLIECNER